MINTKAKKIFFGLALIFAVNNVKGSDDALTLKNIITAITKETGVSSACALIGLLGGATTVVATLSSEGGQKLMTGQDTEIKEKAQVVAGLTGVAVFGITGLFGLCQLLMRNIK